MLKNSCRENIYKTAQQVKNKNRRRPVVTITGGIGSGKSAVAAIFKEKGALILDADSIAKEILWNDCEISRKVIDEFGQDICDENDRISKERLIPRVFRSSDSIRRLNDIMHPPVIKRINEIIQENAYSNKYTMIAVDAALIFEAGVEKEFDYVVTVAAADDLRINRIVARDGVTPEDVSQRMNVQGSQKEHMRKSDYVITNNGSLAELRNQSLLIFEDILYAKYVH